MEGGGYSLYNCWGGVGFAFLGGGGYFFLRNLYGGWGYFYMHYLLRGGGGVCISFGSLFVRGWG